MKFYKLSEADLPLIFEMKESEIKVWCWLSVNLPFGDSNIEIDTAWLSEEIGITRRSIQRALKTLQKKKLFEIEFTKAKIKRRKATQMSSGDTDVAETTQVSPRRRRCRQDDADVAKTTQMSRSQPEKTAQQQSQPSKTIQTYSDFSNSLSEAERESFENFCRNETASLPRPIVSLGDYLAAQDASGKPRYLEFWEKFGRTAAGREMRSQQANTQAAAALTEKLYNQWDEEFRAIGYDYLGFAQQTQRNTPEWDLRCKFLEEWDRRNQNAMPLLR